MPTGEIQRAANHLPWRSMRNTRRDAPAALRQCREIPRRGQRQNHPSAILEPVKPVPDWMRGPGIDQDDFGRREIDFARQSPFEPARHWNAGEIPAQADARIGSYSIAVTRPLRPAKRARIAV